MVEDGRRGAPPDHEEPPEEPPWPGRSGGSGLIFVLVALALILAIGFFYITKQREKNQDRTAIEGVESVDSAARVVGNAAGNMANQLTR
jgi:uncharacterized protein HemX